jgi:hypothetical protein
MSASGRHGGNAESQAAYERLRGSLTRSQKEAADLYRGIYPESLTSKEVARLLNKPLHSVSGRCTEGKQDGWLRPTDVVRDGSRALKWEPSFEYWETLLNAPTQATHQK